MLCTQEIAGLMDSKTPIIAISGPIREGPMVNHDHLVDRFNAYSAADTPASQPVEKAA